MGIRDVIGSRGHFTEDRKIEIIVGFLMFIAACLLLFDAFDARGKKAPWPMGAFTPW